VSEQALFEAIEQGDEARVRAIVSDDPRLASARNEDGLSAVLFATYRLRRELAEELIAAGAELDLFDAAATGRTERLRTLLADDPQLAQAWSADGFTALHYAAFFGDAAGAGVLLDAGADPTAVARNEMLVQPLHSAAAAGQVDVAQLLLEAGADPNAEQQDGYLPLDAANQLGNEPLQRLLRAYGARASR
jgi:ankyrin repeat protein